MNIDTLNKRIENAENKLTKLNGTVERHTKQLAKKAKKLKDQGIDPKNCDRMEHRQTDTYWDICEYDDKVQDIKNNEKKISEVTKTLEKLQEQLKEEKKKEVEENNLCTEVLDEFLENWRKKAHEYYINLANKFIEVKYAVYEITQEELEQITETRYHYNKGYQTLRVYSDEQIQEILKGNYTYDLTKKSVMRNITNRYIGKFKDKHCASEIMVLEKILNKESINEAILNRILVEDVKVKKSMFLARIKKVIGDIIDLTALRIGENGEINGIAYGSLCNAEVKTISAGGYHIQCFHYRVLINKVK